MCGDPQEPGLCQPGAFLAPWSCTTIKCSFLPTHKQLVLLILLWLDVRKCSFTFLFLPNFFPPVYSLHRGCWPNLHTKLSSFLQDLLSGLGRHPSPFRLQSFQHACKEPAMLRALLLLSTSPWLPQAVKLQNRIFSYPESNCLSQQYPPGFLEESRRWEPAFSFTTVSTGENKHRPEPECTCPADPSPAKAQNNFFRRVKTWLVTSPCR